MLAGDRVSGAGQVVLEFLELGLELSYPVEPPLNPGPLDPLDQIGDLQFDAAGVVLEAGVRHGDSGTPTPGGTHPVSANRHETVVTLPRYGR